MEETSHIQQTTQDSLHSLIMRFNKRSKTSSYQKKLHLLCNNNIIVPVKFTSGRKTVWPKGSGARKSMHEQSLKEKTSGCVEMCRLKKCAGLDFTSGFWSGGSLQSCGDFKTQSETKWRAAMESKRRKKGDSIQVNKHFPSSFIHLAQSKEK